MRDPECISHAAYVRTRVAFDDEKETPLRSGYGQSGLLLMSRDFSAFGKDPIAARNDTCDDEEAMEEFT